MEHLLFKQIKEFNTWAQAYSDIPQNERWGEWECDYKDWDKIYEQFEDFIKSSNPLEWTNDIKDQLLYIIARDNEMQRLSEKLEHLDIGIIALARCAIQNSSRDSRWQIATLLNNLQDRNLAIELLEVFTIDNDEYV
jgi:hypothetical protein